MSEPIYPKLADDSHKAEFILEKKRYLQEKLTHYKKVKHHWSIANTILKGVGISVSCILTGASIITLGPFSVPLAAVIMSGLSAGNSDNTAELEGMGKVWISLILSPGVSGHPCRRRGNYRGCAIHPIYQLPVRVGGDPPTWLCVE